MTEQTEHEIDGWWRDLTAAALVGTARRPVPPEPQWGVAPRADASPEILLLDAAALGGAVRRAGRRIGAAESRPAAPDDRLRPAPPRAEQLLRLVLHQSPVGVRLMPAVVDTWLRAARRAGARVPHALLCEVLDLATRREQLRPAARAVIDARGIWLAAANAEWSWVLEEPAEGGDLPDDWARLPTERRAAAVATLRSTDPAAGRELVESTWPTDAAGDRRTLLGTLRIGLGPDDEDFLERALDDRAASVRETACTLLDGLPGSRRARRLGELLRPLISARGLRRRSLEVELPTAPGAAAVRDGLGRSRRGGSERGHWLEQLAAGAPLEVWTDAAAAGPSAAYRMIADADARRGIRRAVVARRDREWARAILGAAPDPELLGVLPQADREAFALDQLSRSAGLAQLMTLVQAVPAPWGASFSRALVDRLAREKDADQVVDALLTELARGLHPDVLPAVRAWAGRAGAGVRDPAHQLQQLLSITPSITEAFR